MSTSRSRTPRAAVATHLGRLQQAVSCVTNTVLVRPRPTPAGRQSVELAGGQVRLRGPLGLTLEFSAHYETFRDEPGGWRATTTAYWYEVRDGDGREILAFHWHPLSTSRVTVPHLHVGGQVGDIALRRRHTPTGIVTLQAVLPCLITEFEVEPLRDDWPEVLAEP